MLNIESFFFTGGFAFSLSALIILLTMWGYQTKIDIEKTSIYECGFSPYQSARNPIEVKFYLVSLLFIVFDVEVLFLFPIAFNLELLTTYDITLILFFIGFMFLGIAYEMRLKAIDF